MNREILFRGKSGDGWHYGLLTKYGNHKWRVVEEDNNMVTVKTNTIGQYTGLTDKNRVKIFEGDIVKTMSSQDAYGTDKFCVQFVQGNFYVCHNDTVWTYSTVWTLRSCAESVKVIGNIYDNPELLQENS